MGIMNNIFEAIIRQNLEQVNFFLNKDGFNVNKAADAGHKGTPLFGAAFQGSLEIVNALLDKGANVDIADKYGYTPLYIASSRGHLKVVNALLDKGADITKEDNWGYTPLDAACHSGHLEVVSALLDKGADVN